MGTPNRLGWGLSVMVGGHSPVPTFETSTSNARAREGFGQIRTLKLRNPARIWRKANFVLSLYK
jgi:hypothetical protein